MSLVIRVLNRKGSELCSLELDNDSTTDDLKKAFYKKFQRWYPDRQYFTIGTDASRVVLQAGKKLSEYKLKTNDTVVFKDLGPQISWKTVFHVEYFGPILFHLLNFYIPQLFYPGYDIKPYCYIQKVAFWCVMIHFLKREFETAFIHRFSNATMPLLNIFKNSTHYWILSGVFLSYFLYHPLFLPTKSDTVVFLFFLAFLVAELLNFVSHYQLRCLRSEGGRERGNPRGQLFELVACANYTYESAAWLIFAIFTQTFTAYVFFLVSFGQMAIWALKKQKQLRKEFPTELRNRKAIIPFIL